MTNRGDAPMLLYYQINYALTEVADDAGYFHAQFRRVNPLPYGEVHTIVDGVRGRGHYVGTYIAWGVNNTGWWGEGEVKFYLDGDQDFPTICGTGTEDYFCGSYNFDVGKENGGYREFTTPYAGLAQVIRPDGLYQSQQRFGMYRWHIMDPIRFRSDLRVTIQAGGVLVSDVADSAVSDAAGARLSANHLSRFANLSRRDENFAVDDFHFMSRGAQARDAHALAGDDIVTEAVAATGHDVAAKLARSQRYSCVRTRIIERVDGAVDVEERDILACDAHDLAFSGPQAIECDGFDEFHHAKLTCRDSH
jgi:hypothetical protein